MYSLAAPCVEALPCRAPCTHGGLTRTMPTWVGRAIRGSSSESTCPASRVHTRHHTQLYPPPQNIPLTPRRGAATHTALPIQHCPYYLYPKPHLALPCPVYRDCLALLIYRNFRPYGACPPHWHCTFLAWRVSWVPCMPLLWLPPVSGSPEQGRSDGLRGLGGPTPMSSPAPLRHPPSCTPNPHPDPDTYQTRIQTYSIIHHQLYTTTF